MFHGAIQKIKVARFSMDKGDSRPSSMQPIGLTAVTRDGVRVSVKSYG